MKRVRVDQYTEEGELISTYDSVREASNVTGVQNILRSIDHPTRTEGGFIWKRSIEQHSYSHYRSKKLDYTDEQRDYFNKRIPSYMPILYNLARSLPFVTYWNKDDYIQEALVWAWVNFYTYEPAANDGRKFGCWFKVVGRSGMYQYYYKFFRGWYVREFEAERFDVPDFIDEEREAKILALYQSLDSLSLEDRKIAILYMNSVPGPEAAKKAGITQTVYYKKVLHLKGILKQRIEYFFFGIKNSRKPLFDGKKGGRGPLPVEQYDLMGKFVARFQTIDSTKEAGFVPSEVSAVINGRYKTHRGYMWKVAKN